MNIEPTRHQERYKMVWPGIPTGLTREQAINWFTQHKKPKLYFVEGFSYNPLTGFFSTVGYEKPCR